MAVLWGKPRRVLLCYSLLFWDHKFSGVLTDQTSCHDHSCSEHCNNPALFHVSCLKHSSALSPSIAQCTRLSKSIAVTVLEHWDLQKLLGLDPSGIPFLRNKPVLPHHKQTALGWGQTVFLLFPASRSMICPSRGVRWSSERTMPFTSPSKTCQPCSKGP